MCVLDSDPAAGVGQALALEEAIGRWSHELEAALGFLQIDGNTDEEAADSAWGRTGNEGGVSRRAGSIRWGLEVHPIPSQESFMLLTSRQVHERESFVLWEWVGGVGKRKEETGSDFNSLKIQI